MDTQAPKRLESIWTPEQCAEYFNVTRVCIYRWIREGRVFNPESIIRISNKIRIPRSEVERVAGVKRDEIFNDATK